MQPVRIGVSSDYETYVDKRGAPAARFTSPEPYVRAINHAKAQAIILPQQPDDYVDGLLHTIDALVISGGDLDVPPDFYGQSARPGLGRIVRTRSLFERALAQEALHRDMPILGICGGMQLLWVLAGGTLHQDLAERPHTHVHEQPLDRRLPHHSVRLVSGSRIAEAYGHLDIEVNSTHHQVVATAGAQTFVTGTAPDGVVEAMELASQSFVVGVQWHPEALSEPSAWVLYGALVHAAQQRRALGAK